MNWNDLCKPKKEGGLSGRNLEIWNLAAISKTTRHINCLHKSLWVRWIHGVYTKGDNWLIFNPPPTATLTLRKLCRVREKLSHWMTVDHCSINACIKSLLVLKRL